MATAAFLAAMNSSATQPVVLLWLVLPRPGSYPVEYRLSTRDLTMPDGTRWQEAIVDPGTVRMPGSYLSSDVGLCSCSLALVMAAPVAAGASLGSLLASCQWSGATATMWLWHLDLTDWADAQQVFAGSVQAFEAEGPLLRLDLRQRDDWNGAITPVAVTRDRWPNAPEESIGAAVPIVYGTLPGIVARPPQWSEDYPLGNAYERVRGGKGTAAGVLVDPGRGTLKAKVLFASHECAAFGEQATGSSPFFEATDRLVPIKPAGGDLFNSDALGTGMLLPDDTGYAYVGLWPARVVVGDKLPLTEEAPALLDPFNDQTFCRISPLDIQDGISDEINYNDIHRFLRAFPSGVLSDTGTLVSVKGIVVYRSFAAANRILGWVSRDTPDPYVRVTGNNPWTLWEVTLDLTQADLGSDSYGYFCAVNGWYPSGTVDIALVGLEVKVVPRESNLKVVQKFVAVTRQRPTKRRFGHSSGPGATVAVSYHSPYSTSDFLPPEQGVKSKFYANLAGQPDDGSGTYTGTPAAVIERPCDVARHMLVKYGEQAAGDLITALSEHGSFVDARADLQTWRGSDMILGFGISEPADVMTALAWVANASMSRVTLSPYDDKFRFLAWGAVRATTRTPIKRNQFIGEPVISMTSASDLTTALRVSYGRDEQSGGYLYETYLSPSRSCAGYKYLNLADETLATISDASDRIDLSTDGSTTAATVNLGALDNDLTDFYAALLAEFCTVFPTPLSAKWAFAIGGQIDATCNRFCIYDGVGSYSLTIPVGTYTMEQLAAAVAAACNVVSTNWTCIYSRVSRKFTIGRTAGTCLVTFIPVAVAGCAAAHLGLCPVAYMGSSSYTSEFPVEEALFALSSDTEFSILWRSGTNGYLTHDPPLTAYAVLGFSAYDNTPLAYWAMGTVPKGTRQAMMTEAVQRYIKASSLTAARRDTTIEARCIQDTDTALELRNRVADAMSRPHVVVSGNVRALVGIERGEIVEFDHETFAAFYPYPDADTDGLWTGKQFVIVEAEQHLGPDNFGTEIVAVSV